VSVRSFVLIGKLESFYLGSLRKEGSRIIPLVREAFRVNLGSDLEYHYSQQSAVLASSLHKWSFISSIQNIRYFFLFKFWRPSPSRGSRDRSPSRNELPHGQKPRHCRGPKPMKRRGAGDPTSDEARNSGNPARPRYPGYLSNTRASTR
jgi:hypothetical protein